MTPGSSISQTAQLRIEDVATREPAETLRALMRTLLYAARRQFFRNAARTISRVYETGGMPALIAAAPAWRAKADRYGMAPASAMAHALDGLEPSRADASTVPVLRLESDRFARDAVLVCVPSGSFVTARSGTITALMARVAKAARLNACIVDYRLAPEHPCPAAVDDVESVVRELIARGQRPERIALVAVSSGASIALAAASRLRDAGIGVSSLSLLSPWTDLALTGLSLVTKPLTNQNATSMEVAALCAHLYLQGVSPFDPVASPVYGDLSKLAPMLIHTSRTDAFHDDARALSERAFQAGTDVTLRIWRNQEHAFEARFDTQAERAIDDVGAFIRERLDR
jgi:monoterpene epsilon-lactone hydrolase